MPLGTTTTATLTVTAPVNMDSQFQQNTSTTISSREQTPETFEDDTVESSPPSTDYEFDESQCLFCNQKNTDLDQNLAHMLKAHGLYLEKNNLLVEVSSLLAYFHLIISGYYECLYCGTERNTRQAVQQHMMAKGHCKYDISDEDSELRDFYDFPSSEAKEKLQNTLDSQLPSQAKSKKPRPSKRSPRSSTEIIDSPLQEEQPPSLSTTTSGGEQTSNVAENNGDNQVQLSTRAQKQEDTLNNQLSRLRADERRSLVHLPASQQRAILATHHKQMEKARRTEQHKRGRLESSGNIFGRLGTVRLVRQPPHFGNVSGLNR
ncbi:hypothetical protein PV10_05257 [Exophiala mesophila]|uniref:ZN622/Rei1/Reh1 zinc finger C2H2-type domain-containing protein n=1 Tax=Exophiala mesophila TaxID=212818 RepID=A0A0D1ZHL5_EXOME|nr:uncharacterized protein PV10_05257 [Exophiala mesophila]KIV94102.1 hypothetical protein PV10_05257 [Exophiala mesophila]